MGITSTVPTLGAREVSATTPRPAVERRLASVDGLRAVAAMWVVLFHIYLFSGVRLRSVPGADLLLGSGYVGVSLFLVLSGFCLYLPVAGGRIARFRSREFLRRRAFRLLPAYYASMAAIVPAKVLAGAVLGFAALSAPELGWQVATHATFTHIFFPSTFYGLNGPYWSLALEWQLYLMLPLVILAIRRFRLRWTLAAMVGVNVAYRLGVMAAMTAGLVPRDSLWPDVLINQFAGRWAEFAFGMAAAELYASGRLELLARRLGRAAAPLSLLAIPGVIAGVAAFKVLPLGTIPMGSAFFLVLLTALLAGGPIFSALAWRPLVLLGTISYSLYLIHQPLIQGTAHLLRGHHFHAGPTTTFACLIVLLPVVIGAATMLFLLVERPSMTWGRARAAALRPEPATA